ncbi:hypothetical protein IM538_04100 [Cytobacillus suaedae]|nr:hypothetical protein IM538_04100 [Cytobacillus suaedae]
MKRTLLQGVIFSTITNLLLFFVITIYLKRELIFDLLKSEEVYYLQNEIVFGYVGRGSANLFIVLVILISFCFFFILFIIIRLIVQAFKKTM